MLVYVRFAAFFPDRDMTKIMFYTLLRLSTLTAHNFCVSISFSGFKIKSSTFSSLQEESSSIFRQLHQVQSGRLNQVQSVTLNLSFLLVTELLSTNQRQVQCGTSNWHTLGKLASPSLVVPKFPHYILLSTPRGNMVSNYCVFI